MRRRRRTLAVPPSEHARHALGVEAVPNPVGGHHERAAGFDLLGALREPRPMPFGSDCFVYDVRRLCLTR